MRLIFLISMTLVLAACALTNAVAPTPTPEPTCGVLATTFLAETEPLLHEWDDAVTLAGQTPRVQLSGQIAALQALRRRAEGLAPPACATALQGLVIAAMNDTIDGFLAFASGKDGEILATVMLDAGKRDLTAARHALRTLPSLTEPFTALHVEAIQTAYPELSWQQPVDHNGRQLVRGERSPFHLELATDGTTLYKITAFSSGPTGDAVMTEIQTDLADFLRQTLPDWTASQSWLEGVFQKSLTTPAQTTVGWHTITVQRLALAGSGEQQFFVTVYLP